MTYHRTELQRIFKYYKKDLTPEYKSATGFITNLETPLTERAITQKEHEQLISQFWELDKWHVMFSILWETGCRCVEACNMRVDMIDFERKKITYVIAKPRTIIEKGQVRKVYKTRTCPVSESLTKKLKDYININASQLRWGYLFPNRNLYHKCKTMPPNYVNEVLDHAREKMGGRFLIKMPTGRDGKKRFLLSVHSWRRSFITRLVRQYRNLSPFEIARMIGHSKVETTYRYFMEENVEKLASFVESSSTSIKSVGVTKDQQTLQSYN